VKERAIPSPVTERNAARVPVVEIIDRSTLGGGQKTVLWLTQGLSGDPHVEIRIACGAGGLMWRSFEAGAAGAHDILLRRVPSPLSLVRLHRLLKTRRVGVVHTHGGIAGLWGRLAARFAGVPVIVHTLHGIHYLHDRNPLARAAGIALERFLGRFTYRTIYVSASDLASCRKHRLSPEDGALLIPNAVPAPDAARASSAAEAFGVPEGSFVIGCIARMDPVKAHPVLFEAFGSISSLHSHARLVLVGGGPLEAEYRRLVERLGLTERVRFLGFVPDGPALLNAMDVVVLPSLWEGMSLSLLEAMAAERPIVASRIGGIVDLVEDRVSALLVEPGDAVALAEALDQMIRSPDLGARLAAAARASFLRHHRIETMIAQVRDVYVGGLRRAGRL
jgi:glycosyltransferase involved in cell wall biosynthesis